MEATFFVGYSSYDVTASERGCLLVPLRVHLFALFAYCSFGILHSFLLFGNTNYLVSAANES